MLFEFFSQRQAKRKSSAHELESLAQELGRFLKALKPALPVAFEKIPPNGWHSSEYQVDAIKRWAKQNGLSKDATLRRFLQHFCDHHRSWRGPFVLLAQLLLKAKDYKGASDAIELALSMQQLDLFAQQVERGILSAIDKRKVDQFAETEEYLKGSFCSNPFEKLETSYNGDAYLCCPAWLPVAIGNIERQTPEEIWLGPAAAEIRKSILDGSFRYCSRTHCSRNTNRRLPPLSSQPGKDPTSVSPLPVKERISQYRRDGAATAIPSPKYLTLSHDLSCNLACPSCRKDFIVANKERQAKLDKIAEEVLLPLLKHANGVCITGSGDPFGSNHFRRLIGRINRDDFPSLKIDLHSNGQLFDRRGWRDLGLEGLVGYVQISIDAARKETYEVVRRGGSFDRLLQNLEFISELRHKGEIRYLDFSMVVQAKNFEEMPDFVRLGKRYGADHVQFNMIRNWGTFSVDEFQAELIGSRSHPRYVEFTEMLKDGIFDDPVVQLGEIKRRA